MDLLEPGFQSFYAVVELAQRIAHGAQIGLHGRWGLLPVLRVKGNGQPVLAGSGSGSMTSPVSYTTVRLMDVL